MKILFIILCAYIFARGDKNSIRCSTNNDCEPDEKCFTFIHLDGGICVRKGGIFIYLKYFCF